MRGQVKVQLKDAGIAKGSETLFTFVTFGIVPSICVCIHVYME